MREIFIALICCFSLSACMPPPQSLLINRSGQNVIVCWKNWGVVVLDGCDNTFNPLPKVKDRSELIYIKNTNGAPDNFFQGDCPDTETIATASIFEMIENINDYKSKHGISATYVFDENANLRFIPHNERPRVYNLGSEVLMCR